MAPFTYRTAAEARAQGSRFGIKLFQIGHAGVWWNRRIVYGVAESVEASSRLGLQWSPHVLDQGLSDQPGRISTLHLNKGDALVFAVGARPGLQTRMGAVLLHRPHQRGCRGGRRHLAQVQRGSAGQLAEAGTAYAAA